MLVIRPLAVVLFCLLADVASAGVILTPSTRGRLSKLALHAGASSSYMHTPSLRLRGGTAVINSPVASTADSHKAPELFEAIWDAKEKHGDHLSPEALQEVLDTLREYPEFFFLDETPKVETIRAHAFVAQDRMQLVAVFSHSLERNGANIFLQILLQHCTDQERQEFELFSPSDGPLRKAFEKMGVKVHITNSSDPDYMDKMEKRLQNFGAVFANTIMRAEVIRLAQQLGMPYTWVIHEAWPREQFDWYASKVFLQEGIDGKVIKDAFAAAEPNKGNVIFPAKIQMGLYDGLIDKDACQVIYNGIPVDAIDRFQSSKNRKAVRAELGYTDDDFLVLHLGTVCSRKCQHVSAEAFSKLVNEKGVKNGKLLIVGARYIRQHEIEYISKVKAILKKGNVMSRATIMDIHEHVLRFYMAADVVLVPSKNEVLPLVISEAQAFKRPLVASNIDGLPEAITDGEEGLLIPPEDPSALCDAIFKLYQSDELRVQMGNKGRERVLRQFSHKAMTQKYMQLVDKMAPQAPPPQEQVSKAAGAAAYIPPLRSNLPSSTPEPIPTEPVLVDMDMVITDWDGEFLRRWLQTNPEDEKLVRGRTKFEIERNFPMEKRDAVLNLIKEEGFYTSMKPFEGAIDALKAMVDEGIDVRIVSAPHSKNAADCAKEKYDWVAEHLGENWIDRLILARDKTHVMGCMLIDDKPHVRGSATPSWEHVIFSQPWNTHVQGKRRISGWKNWRDVVGLAPEAQES